LTEVLRPGGAAVLTHDELRRLLTVAGTPRVRAVIALGAFSGLPSRDICDFKFGDVKGLALVGHGASRTFELTEMTLTLTMHMTAPGRPLREFDRCTFLCEEGTMLLADYLKDGRSPNPSNNDGQIRFAKNGSIFKGYGFDDLSNINQAAIWAGLWKPDPDWVPGYLNQLPGKMPIQHQLRSNDEFELHGLRWYFYERMLKAGVCSRCVQFMSGLWQVTRKGQAIPCDHSMEEMRKAYTSAARLELQPLFSTLYRNPPQVRLLSQSGAI